MLEDDRGVRVHAHAGLSRRNETRRDVFLFLNFLSSFLVAQAWIRACLRLQRVALTQNLVSYDFFLVFGNRAPSECMGASRRSVCQSHLILHRIYLLYRDRPQKLRFCFIS